MNKLKVAKIIHLLDLKTNNHNSRLVEDSIMHTHQTSPKENVLATNPQVRSTVCRTRNTSESCQGIKSSIWIEVILSKTRNAHDIKQTCASTVGESIQD
jgi:hypothetical protein